MFMGVWLVAGGWWSDASVRAQQLGGMPTAAVGMARANLSRTRADYSMR
jgi:hypothetical protein